MPYGFAAGKSQTRSKIEVRLLRGDLVTRDYYPVWAEITFPKQCHKVLTQSLAFFDPPRNEPLYIHNKLFPSMEPSNVSQVTTCSLDY